MTLSLRFWIFPGPTLFNDISEPQPSDNLHIAVYILSNGPTLYHYWELKLNTMSRWSLLRRRAPVAPKNEIERQGKRIWQATEL